MSHLLSLFITTSLALIFYIIYFVIIAAKFGLLPSISTSWYRWEIKKPGTGLYFSSWCGILGGLTLPALLYLTEGSWWSFLSFISVFGLWFVGIAPDFMNKKYYTWHAVGAVMSGVSAVMIACLEGYWILTVGFLFLNFIIQVLTKKLDRTLWIENAAFLINFNWMLIALYRLAS